MDGGGASGGRGNVIVIDVREGEELTVDQPCRLSWSKGKGNRVTLRLEFERPRVQKVRRGGTVLVSGGSEN